jgi:hypothetical protein
MNILTCRAATQSLLSPDREVGALIEKAATAK